MRQHLGEWDAVHDALLDALDASSAPTPSTRVGGRDAKAPWNKRTTGRIASCQPSATSGSPTHQSAGAEDHCWCLSVQYLQVIQSPPASAIKGHAHGRRRARVRLVDGPNIILKGDY